MSLHLRRCLEPEFLNLQDVSVLCRYLSWAQKLLKPSVLLKILSLRKFRVKCLGSSWEGWNLKFGSIDPAGLELVGTDEDRLSHYGPTLQDAVVPF